MPINVALEVFNEPPPPCQWPDRDEWSDQLKQIYDRVREAAPKLTLFVAGACWASLEGLKFLDPAQFDGNTIFVFHFYEPFVFTHQGFWGSSEYLQYVPPLSFPPDPLLRDSTVAAVAGRIRTAMAATPEARDDEVHEAHRELMKYFDDDQGPRFIAAQFEDVANWADSHGLDRGQIMLGEFGAMRNVYGKEGARPMDRARWIAAVRKGAERFGFRWAVWSLTNTMGIVTGDFAGPLDPTIIQALGLNPS